ncbi:MAG: tetratricopeptide repeat protein [Gammaproteobacteria bacterium]|nr:tetratricopeptide repeat protein [Gammaproteobacteria bacterium]
MLNRCAPVTLLFCLALLGLAACTDTDQAPTQEATPQTLTLIARPDPSTMDDTVAKLVTEAWEELNATLGRASATAEETANAYARYGLTAFGNGLSLPAEMAFENASALMPKDVRWIYFLALVSEYQGNLEQAEQRFNQVLSFRPSDPPTMLRLAKVYFEQGRMEEATALYEKILQADSGSASAHYGMGRVASAQSNYREAVEHFERALALQPSADRIHYFLGQAWRSLNDLSKAKFHLQKRGTSEPHFVDPLFDQISGGESRIEGLWTHMNAGSQAFVDGDYTVAAEQFRLATENLPDDSRSWQSLGMALNKTGDSQGATAAYEKALELAGDDAVIRHELAKLLYSSGAHQAAQEHLTRALEKDPKMLAALKTQAQMQRATNRADAALNTYDKALALDPQSSDLIIAKAEVLLDMNQAETAVDLLLAANQINPQDPDLLMTLGLIMADIERPADAVAHLKQALLNAQDDDTRSRAHYALGFAQQRGGTTDAALASYAKAIELNPRHQAAHLSLARTHFQMRQLDDAMAAYQGYLSRWPDHDSVVVEAAQLSLMLGNGRQALQLLEARASSQSASPRLLGSLARLLVLSGDSSIADPQRALLLAEQALIKNGAPAHAETLALSQAANGQFDEAVKLQQHILKVAADEMPPTVLQRVQANLQRYQSGSLGNLPFDAR